MAGLLGVGLFVTGALVVTRPEAAGQLSVVRSGGRMCCLVVCTTRGVPPAAALAAPAQAAVHHGSDAGKASLRTAQHLYLFSFLVLQSGSMVEFVHLRSVESCGFLRLFASALLPQSF
jgi:hypothetical protein